MNMDTVASQTCIQAHIQCYDLRIGGAIAVVYRFVVVEVVVVVKVGLVVLVLKVGVNVIIMVATARMPVGVVMNYY